MRELSESIRNLAHIENVEPKYSMEKFSQRQYVAPTKLSIHLILSQLGYLKCQTHPVTQGNEPQVPTIFHRQYSHVGCGHMGM